MALRSRAGTNNPITPLLEPKNNLEDRARGTIHSAGRAGDLSPLSLYAQGADRGGTAMAGGGGLQGGFLLFPVGRGPAAGEGVAGPGQAENVAVGGENVAVRAGGEWSVGTGGENPTSLSAVDRSALPRQEQARAPSSGEEWESADSDSEGTRQGTSVL